MMAAWIERLGDFFFVNEQAPDSGGTGHTMRVCQHLGGPVITQDAWRQWATPSVK